MKLKRMNKKGLEDSVFTWIVAFLVIFFVMIIYLILVFFMFGTGKVASFFGGTAKEDLSKNLGESDINLNANAKFLDFLNRRVVLVNGLDAKVIDVIKNPAFAEEENFKIIVNVLEDGCSTRSLFLEIPQGIITTEGTVLSRKELDSGVHLRKGSPPYYNYDSIIHKNIYDGEIISISSGVVFGALNSNKIDLWGGLCK